MPTVMRPIATLPWSCDSNVMPVPDQPKIYHIVHIDNLASIVDEGCLWSDSVMVQRKDGTVIGMGDIKQRRLGLPVSCHKGTNVGEYVPFYFCPRSIMLYVIHCANHPGLAYQGGQRPIIHLESDLQRVVQWAEANQRRWAFSLSNAGAVYTQFRASLDRLEEVNWDSVAATDFRPADIKEGKQAEFMVERSFPWHLVERIGVHSQSYVARVSDAMHGAAHRPRLEIKQEWYY
jgi:ssDNA thymidine ADP-ribosyltransferase, DarT